MAMLLFGIGRVRPCQRRLGAGAHSRKAQDCKMGAAMPHNPSALHWDDLKHLLAVARHGSTLAAGRALGVDQSTVQRRLAELERRLGHPLVERHTSGYRLTDFGREMLPAAERMAEAANAFEAHLQVAGATASGVIRLTCPEPIVKRLAQSALFDKFHARHPQWRVQFVMS